MKKQVSHLVAVLLTLLTVFSVLTPVAFCAEQSPEKTLGKTDPRRDDYYDCNDNDKEETQPDGHHEITIVNEPEISTGIIGDDEIQRDANIGNCSKKATVRDDYYSGKQLMWSVWLTAYFDYNGVSSNCTTASITYKIYDDDWTFRSQDVKKLSNSATSCVKFNINNNGVPMWGGTSNLKISCDKNGKITYG